jgi:hypothetical protein
MALRERVTGIIDKHLDQYLDPYKRIDLERGIYNASLNEATRKGVRKHWENPDFAEIYKMVARRVVANLEPEAYVGNARLIQRLQEGEFPPHRVPFMTPRELYPEHWQPLADEQMKRENTMLEGDKEGGRGAQVVAAPVFRPLPLLLPWTHIRARTPRRQA